jgi:Complex1_LYR-like
MLLIPTRIHHHFIAKMRTTLIHKVARPSFIARYASPTSTNVPPIPTTSSSSTSTSNAKQRRPRKSPTGVGSEVGLAAAALLPPLPLYRRIMKAHKFLPLEMKSLGDQYVRDEFKRHASTENPLQIVGFLTQWKVYLDNLETQSGTADGYRGRQLDMEQFGKLSDEQLYQLHELMTVTRELYDPEKAQAQPPGGNQAVHDAVQDALDRVKGSQDGGKGDGENQR